MEEGYLHQMTLEHKRNTVKEGDLPLPVTAGEGTTEMGFESNPYLPSDKLFVNRLSKKRDRLQSIADLNEQSKPHC